MSLPFRLLTLPILLGAFTTAATTFALAVFTPVPMYPRDVRGQFVRWNTPWNAVEAHRFGLVHIWWSDLDEDYIFENAPPAPAPRSAQEIVAFARIKAQAIEDARKGGEFWHKLRHTPRPWGTFAANQPPPEPFTMGSDAGFGWPFSCMWYQILTILDKPTASTVHDELHGGIRLSGTPASRGTHYTVLPLLPHYPGLILNTAFYASLWALLLFAPPALRRTLRIRRGHCTRCGYDVQRNYASPCPECGTTTP